MIVRASRFMDKAALAPFKAVRSELEARTGNDVLFYEVLRRSGHEAVEDINNEADRLSVLSALEAERDARHLPAKAEKRQYLAFEHREQFKTLRTHLNWLTKTDAAFDAILAQFGFKQIDDIPTREAAYPAYRALVAKRNELQLTKEQLEELNDAYPF